MKREEEDPESLADYVRRTRNALGLSLLDVERESARTGAKIAGSYVSRIESRRARNPSKDKLMALARGLGVSQEEVFAAATGKRRKGSERTMAVDNSEVKLLLSYRSLSVAAQENLVTIARALHRAEQEKKPNAA